VISEFRYFVSKEQDSSIVINDALKRVILCSYQSPAIYPYDSLEINLEVLPVETSDDITTKSGTDIKEVDVSRKDLIS